MKVMILTILASFFLQIATAQTRPVIIPEPVKMDIKKGKFLLSNTTAIIASDALANEAQMLNAYLQQLFGITLSTSSTGKNSIVLQLKDGEKNPEAYHLQSDSKKLAITASDARGIFMGIQTLLQLIPPQRISEDASFSIPLPQLAVYDYPAFAYRGMHLDVSRHFFDVAFIKKYIDYLAMQKFNTFHWHLTDDQGWRIEIKQYPRLTSIGAFRNGTIIGRYPGNGNTEKKYGGFYTQDQIRDVVKYAASRHVTIIPEIELPGHASAAIAAYPFLSCFPAEPTKAPARTTWSGPVNDKAVQQAWGVFPDVFCPRETTFKFLEDVLDEVMALFPSTYIHIGGDECPKENWKRCPHCQQLIKEHDLKDEHGLQSYFVQTIEKYLNGKGRQIIGWDEILEGGLAPNATVMSWRGEKGGIAAAEQDHDVIMTPNSYLYFDYSQTKTPDSVTIGGFIPLKNVYGYQPVPKELDPSKGKYILGAQANVWTEYMHSPSKVEYMVFPRMSALSEALWTPGNKKDWNRFKGNLADIYKRYELWGANYFRKSAAVMAEK